MTKEEIIELMNANLSCFLATTAESQPHVRGMMAYKATERGIIFHTGNTKDLYKQIVNNPLVEICFFDPKKNIQIRVTGKAVILDDLELKKEITEARPFLKPWVERMGYDMLIVFQVIDCIAHTWTFETNLSPKEFIKIN